MKWFKHDTDASIDAKLQELLLDYGASGYGLYWYCVELIAGNVSASNITFELEHDARIIARNLSLSHQECKDMMMKMVKLGLFDITKNEKIACYAIAKRLDSSMTSNPEMRAIIHGIKDKSHDKVMIKSVISHDKVMQEEKRIEEKDITAKASLVDAYALEDEALTDQGKQILQKFVDYRKRIKEPIKTTAPLKAFIKVMREAVKSGYTPDSIFELMESREWQTVKMEWIVKEIVKTKEWTE